MGDRTHVTLTLEREAYLRVEKEPWFDQPNEVTDRGIPTPAMGKGRGHSRSMTMPMEEFVDLDYEEVNYGELDCIDKLTELGIAFTSEWGNGDNYGPGSTTCRFNANGDRQILHLPESEENPPLAELMKLIDVPGQMVAYVVHYHDTHTPWPFKHQGDYGRIYLTKQLLQPNKE